MELRKAGEALLRSQSSFLPFLAPLIRRPAISSLVQLRTSSPAPIIAQSRRPFTSSITRHQQAAAAAAPEPPDEHDNDAPGADNPASSTTPFRPASRDDDISTLLDDVVLDRQRTRTGQARTTRPNTPGAQPLNRTAYPSRSSSADDVRSQFDSTFSLSRRQGQRSMNIEDMLMPYPTAKGAQSLSDPPPAENAAERAPTLRLNSSTGRSVVVDANKGVDLGRGFRALDILCARNRVRADFNRQRFHERPGLKRKRLGRERWRKRFKAGFQAVVRRVEEMRRKGW